MPRKSAYMLKANVHSVIIHGHAHKVTKIEKDGDVIVIHLADRTEPLRRTRGTKLDVL